MTKTTIRSGDLVVVCDGRKALILENLGDGVHPNLRMREVLEHDDRLNHEQGSEAPGRVQQSMGSARSAVEPPDWQRDAERHFLEMLARELDAEVTRSPAKRLTVVAAPRALGMLRHAYSPAVRHAISAELDKDWVKMPIYEIEKQLQRAEAGPH
jgi:protein required for attachment to host cells